MLLTALLAEDVAALATPIPALRLCAELTLLRDVPAATWRSCETELRCAAVEASPEVAARCLAAATSCAARVADLEATDHVPRHPRPAHPGIDVDRAVNACTPLHSAIIAACQLGYQEAIRLGDGWLVRAIKCSWEAGNVGRIAEYLETLAILIETDEADLLTTPGRCAALRAAAERALDAAEDLNAPIAEAA